MKSKKLLKVGNRVFVKSFAGPDVYVTLKNRYIASESKLKLGVDGWEAQIKDNKEVEKLRKAGVPYDKGEAPPVWVFDWQII
tara:strand:- start:460 stop:705 length:246 start_codon:yes stop_codon:yes gene_type:complete